MKYLLVWILTILLLSGCKSTIPSESIATGVISDLNAHQQAISILDKQTAKECKTDAFMASLTALKSQTESIAGQVKSITNACQTEKRVLEQSITIRNIIIGTLGAIIGLILFVIIRRR